MGYSGDRVPVCGVLDRRESREVTSTGELPDARGSCRWGLLDATTANPIRGQLLLLLPLQPPWRLVPVVLARAEMRLGRRDYAYRAGRVGEGGEPTYVGERDR